MTRRFEPLRSRTHAHTGLLMLTALAGSVDFAGWKLAMTWGESDGRFVRQVVNPLMLRNYVYVRGSQYCITDAGLAFLGRGDVPAKAPYVGSVAGPAYVAPMRPLSKRHRPDLALRREGAQDYRSIPSLHGGQRVAYGAGLSGAGVAPE
ncbi:MAG: hypothetical protein ABIT83_20160 [Massilia sp.]